MSESPSIEKQESSWTRTAKEFVGKIIGCTVTRTEQYFALLTSPSLPLSQIIYLHISEYSSNFTKDLRNELTVGQSISVVVLKFNRDNEKWEASKRIFDGLPSELLRFDEHAKITGKVLSINSLGANVEFSGFQGRIATKETEFLSSMGMLHAGKTINAKIIRIDTKNPGALVTCAALSDFSEGEVIDAQVHSIEIDKQDGRARARIVWTLRAIAADGSIVLSKLWKTCDPLSRFTSGAKVTLRIIRRSKSNFYHWADVIGTDELISPYTDEPKINQLREATIHVVVNFGAFCTIVDGREDLIHRTKVIRESSPELREHLSPGDVVLVKVRAPKEKEIDYGLDFIKLLRRLPDEGGMQNEAPLFDLHAEKRIGAASGFIRSPRFKQEITKAFNHTCVICGIQQLIAPEYSAAEAAHIIPRSNRGADEIHNGLCLCRLHHWAFDRGFITLSDEKIVLVCKALHNKSTDLAAHFTALHGRNAFWPSALKYPTEALIWHRRNLFIESPSLELDT